MTMIEDGTGSGRKAEVDDRNHLHVHAYSVLELEMINEKDGQVFDIPLDAVAPSGATYFFVLQNNGQSTYAMYKILIASSVAGVFRLEKVTGTPAGGTSVTANTMNLGKVSVLDSVLLQTGASITGLTASNPLKLLYLPANQLLQLDIPSRIYMPPGAMLALKAPVGATVNGDLLIYRE